MPMAAGTQCSQSLRSERAAVWGPGGIKFQRRDTPNSAVRTGKQHTPHSRGTVPDKGQYAAHPTNLQSFAGRLAGEQRLHLSSR